MQSQIWDYRPDTPTGENSGVEKEDVRRSNLRAWIASSPEANVTAFARKWNLRQSHLSEILSGKRPFGERLARSIEKKAKIPRDYLDRINDGPKEPTASYHGISLTRAGALLGAEWEKLDLDKRIEYEQKIYAEVAKKVRNSRKVVQLRPHDDDE
jgi:hypothetical protein